MPGIVSKVAKHLGRGIMKQNSSEMEAKSLQLWELNLR